MPRGDGAAGQSATQPTEELPRPRERRRVLNRLSVLRALHPFPSFLVALVTMVLVRLVRPDAPLERYVTLGLGMLLFQFAIGLTNDIVDVRADRVGKPWKPLARGVASRRAAVIAAVVLAGAGLLLTLPLPLEAWLIGVLGLGLGLAYDLLFKRTILSWLPFAIAIPLVPIWVYVALEVWNAILWWVLPLGATLGLGLHLANQAPDAADDDGLPGVLGESRSRLIATAIFVCVALAAALVLLPGSRGHSLASLGIGLIAAAGSRTAPRAFGQDGLFGLHAVGAAALAVVFLSAV